MGVPHMTQSNLQFEFPWLQITYILAFAHYENEAVILHFSTYITSSFSRWS